MSHTITIRITQELAVWLETTARTTGLPRGRIIREHLERAMTSDPGQSFLRLAGTVSGPRDLSTRKGFQES